MKLCALDFGHGGGDPGAVGHGLKESDLIREIGRNLVYDLTLVSGGACAIVCVSPLDTDVKLRASNTSRARLANAAAADIYVAIHVNAATSAGARGFEVIYHDGSKRGASLAQWVHDALLIGGLAHFGHGVSLTCGVVARRHKHLLHQAAVHAPDPDQERPPLRALHGHLHRSPEHPVSS